MARFISVTGDGSLTVLLPILVTQGVLGVWFIGAYAGARGVARVLSSLLASGVLGSLDRRRTLIAADLLRAIALITVAVIGLSEASLVVVAVTLGIGESLFEPSIVAYTSDVAEAAEGRRPDAGALATQAAHSLVFSARRTALIAGPLVGAAATTVLGGRAVVAADGASFAASAAILCGRTWPAIRGRRSPGWQAARYSWALVWHSAQLRGALALDALQSALCIAPFFALFPIAAQEQGSDRYSILLAGAGVGALLGSVAARRVRTRRPMLVAVALQGAFVVTIAVTARSLPLAVTALTFVVSAACVEVGGVLEATALTGVIASSDRSAVLVNLQLAAAMAATIGSFAAAFLGAAFGVHAVLDAAALLLTVLTVTGWLFTRRWWPASDLTPNTASDTRSSLSPPQ